MSRLINQISISELITKLNQSCNEIVAAGFLRCSVSINLLSADSFEIQWTIILRNPPSIFRYQRRVDFNLLESEFDQALYILIKKIIENPSHEGNLVTNLAV